MSSRIGPPATRIYLPETADDRLETGNYKKETSGNILEIAGYVPEIGIYKKGMAAKRAEMAGYIVEIPIYTTELSSNRAEIATDMNGITGCSPETRTSFM